MRERWRSKRRKRRFTRITRRISTCDSVAVRRHWICERKRRARRASRTTPCGGGGVCDRSLRRSLSSSTFCVSFARKRRPDTPTEGGTTVTRERRRRGMLLLILLSSSSYRRVESISLRVSPFAAAAAAESFRIKPFFRELHALRRGSRRRTRSGVWGEVRR